MTSTEIVEQLKNLNRQAASLRKQLRVVREQEQEAAKLKARENKKPVTRYCVMTYGGKILYEGRSVTDSAEFMDPGTVCGAGPTAEEARWSASRQIGNLGKPEPSKAI